MKRNMDLVREILLEIEKQPYTGNILGVHLEGYSKEEITYHVMLLHEAGFIEAFDLSTMGLSDWMPIRIMWEGHEFLDAARDEARWKRAKEMAAEREGGLPFEVLKELLIQLTRAEVLGG